MVNDVSGQILRNGVEVRRRWAEYFELVLNVTDVTEADRMHGPSVCCKAGV